MTLEQPQLHVYDFYFPNKELDPTKTTAWTSSDFAAWDEYEPTFQKTLNMYTACPGEPPGEAISYPQPRRIRLPNLTQQPITNNPNVVSYPNNDGSGPIFSAPAKNTPQAQYVECVNNAFLYTWKDSIYIRLQPYENGKILLRGCTNREYALKNTCIGATMQTFCPGRRKVAHVHNRRKDLKRREMKSAKYILTKKRNVAAIL